MSLQKLSPYAGHNVNVAATGGWKAIGFGSTGQFTNASLLAAVTDGSDTTYIVNVRWDVTGQVVYNFHAPSIPALAQIRSVSINVRCQPNFSLLGIASASENVVFAFVSADGFTYSGATYLTVTQEAAVPATPTDFPLVLPGAPTSGAWVPSVFEGLQLTIFGPTDPSAGGRLLEIDELYLLLDVNEAPVITLAVDANPEILTQRPTLSLTYADPEGDPMERFEYRFYAVPPGGWAGFNPDTTTQVPVASEVVFTNNLAYRVPFPIPNNTYRVYGRAADQGSGGRFGAWVFADIVVAVPPPQRPTIAVQGDVANCQVVGKVTIVGPTLKPFGAMVQRRNDDGSWSTVMECGNLQPTGGSAGNGWTWTVPFRDRTAPRDKVLTYQAITIGADNDNFSQPSPAAQVLLPDDGNSWLILGSTDASMDMAVGQIGGAGNFQLLTDEDQFEFTAEGRVNFVVVSGTVHGFYQTANTGLQFSLGSDADKDLFLLLRGQRKPVLVKTRFGDSGLFQLWVRLGKTATIKPMGSGTAGRGPRKALGQQWIVQIPYYQVDQPAI